MGYIPLTSQKNSGTVKKPLIPKVTTPTVVKTPTLADPKKAGYVPLSAKPKKRGLFQAPRADLAPNALDIGTSSLASGLLKGFGSIIDQATFLGNKVTKVGQKVVNKIAGEKFAPQVQTIRPKRELFAKAGEAVKAGQNVTPAKQGYWGQAAESLGFATPAMIAGFATGGAGAMVAGGLEAGSEAQGVYDDLKSKGVDEKEAKKKAAATFGANAILNTITNKLGIFSGNMNKIPGVKGKVVEFFKDAILELSQESAQQVISNVATGQKWNYGIKDTALAALPQTILFSGAGVISKKGGDPKDEEDIKILEEVINNGMPEAQTEKPKAGYKPLTPEAKAIVPTITAEETAEIKEAPAKLRVGQEENARTDDFVARERYDIPNLKKISFGGSDRDVYDLGDNRVLKVAKSSRGLDQNASSSDYYAEDRGPIPKTFETGKNYLVKEKVLPPDSRVRKMIKDLLTVRTFYGDPNTSWNPKDNQISKEKLVEVLEKYGYPGQELFNYDPLWGDLLAVRNWGVSLEGKPMLLDEGTLNGGLVRNSSRAKGKTDLQNPEFREVYNQSRAAKKKYGDTDQKTKYNLNDDVKFDRSTEEIQKSLNKIFGREIPVKEVFNAELELGNKDAVGRAKKDLILLLKENGSLSEAVANHEGYHWAKRNMPKADADRLTALENEMAAADPKEVQRLKDLGYKESDIPEEMGANEFAKFYATGKTTFGKIKAFFDQILKKLKMIFSRRRAILREFADIKKTVAKEGARPESKKSPLKIDDNAEPMPEEKIFTSKDPITYLADIADSFEAGSLTREALEAWQGQLSNAISELEIYEPGGTIIQKDDGYIKSQATSLKELPPEARQKKVVEETLEAMNNGEKPKSSKAMDLYNFIIGKYFSYLDVEYQNEIGSLLAVFEERGKRSEKEIQADLKAVRKTEGPQTASQVKKNIAGMLYKGLRDSKFTFSERALFAKKIRDLNRGFKIGFVKGRQVGLAQGKNKRENIIAELRRAFDLKTLKTGILSRETQNIKNQIKEYVIDSLPLSERGKFLTMTTSAKSRKDLIKAFFRIDEAVKSVEKKQAIRDLKKMYSKILDSNQIDVDYKEKVKDLLGNFDFVDRRESTINKLKKLQTFVENNRDAAMPSYVYGSLKVLNRKALSEMSLAEILNLQESVNLLLELGTTKKLVRDRLYEIEKDKKKNMVLSSIVPLSKSPLLERVPGKEKLSTAKKFKNLFPSILNFFQRINVATMPMDVFFDMLDGSNGTYAGPVYRTFKGALDTKYGNYLADRNEVYGRIEKIMDELKLNEQNFERIGIHAAKVQEGGMKKLLDTGLEKSYIDSVVLNDREMKMYNAMRAEFDRIRKPIADTMKNIYNKPLGNVENYFSFMTDFDAMDEAEVFQRIGPEAPEFGRPTKTVEQGFTKERVGGKQKIKLDAMDIFKRHIDNASYLINMGREVKMLSEISNSQEFKEKAGELGQKYVIEWMDLMARKGGKGGSEKIALLDALRRNIGAGYLGFKLSSAMLQPSALLDGASVIGGYAFRGAAEVGTSRDVRRFILRTMPEIRARLGDDVAFTEFSDDKPLQRVQNAGMYVLKKLDGITASSVAWGAYLKKMKQLGQKVDLNNPNKEALEYAQQVVRRTQSSSQFKDAAMALSRGSLTGNRSFDRAFLQFQSFVLTRWHRFKHTAWDAGIKKGKPQKAFGQLFWLFLAALAEEGLRRGSKELISLLTGKEAENQDSYTQGSVKNALSTIPFVGQYMNLAIYEGDSVPSLGALTDTLSGPFKIAERTTPQGKKNAVIDTLAAGGSAVGIPGTQQAKKLIKDLTTPEKKSTTTTSSATPSLPKLPALPKLPKLPSL